MSRRVIRTVDGQVFSDSKGRFLDRRGEILYKRGFFNTVRINKRSITSDDVSGSSIALIFAVLAVILVAVLLLLSAYSLATSESLNDDGQHNPNVTDIASNTKTAPETEPKVISEMRSETTAEAKAEVVVDVESGNYFFLGCSQLGRVKQHNRRKFNEQQAISFGYKKHRSC